MTDLSAEFKALAHYRPTHKVRFVTAASLFDGHDAAINIMRRILQGMGAEVIHLGHNRSVDEVVTAALQEDAQGIAISSYQGGHVEYFKYMVDLLKQRGGAHIQVFGGGGGVIVPPEIRDLQSYGVARIYSPEDGQRMGLRGMIGEMVMRCDADLSSHAPQSVDAIQGHSEAAWRALAQLITALQNGKADGIVPTLHEQAKAAKVAVLDLIIVETSGIGQGDAAIVPLVDVPMYVMTPEYGAASQLEKIDMLDFAEFVAINKFDRKGAADALRDVAKQVQRNRDAFKQMPDEMPVFGTMASRFNDDGVTALYQALKPRLAEVGLKVNEGRLPAVDTRHSTHQVPIVPGARVRYLAEIADTVRGYKARARMQSRLAREVQQLRETARMLTEDNPDQDRAVQAVNALAAPRQAKLDAHAKKLLAQWPQMLKAYSGDAHGAKTDAKP